MRTQWVASHTKSSERIDPQCTEAFNARRQFRKSHMVDSGSTTYSKSKTKLLRSSKGHEILKKYQGRYNTIKLNEGDDRSMTRSNSKRDSSIKIMPHTANSMIQNFNSGLDFRNSLKKSIKKEKNPFHKELIIDEKEVKFRDHDNDIQNRRESAAVPDNNKLDESLNCLSSHNSEKVETRPPNVRISASSYTATYNAKYTTRHVDITDRDLLWKTPGSRRNRNDRVRVRAK
jgi:hypothetical protein